MNDAAPTVVLRTAVSMLANYDKNIEDNSIEATRNRSLRLTSQLPTISAILYRYRNNLPFIGISKTLSHAAITTFLGPLHGGSIEQTMKMLREVETPEHVHFRSYIRMVCKCS